MPMKCILEHCEFANGGHCALVCPKHLELRLKRQAEVDKIEACVAMLRRVYDCLETNRTCERRNLPVGVYFYRGSYLASISHNGKVVTLGSSKDLDKIIALRENAEKAKAEGILDEFLRKLKAERKKAKKAKKAKSKVKGRKSKT